MTRVLLAMQSLVLPDDVKYFALGLYVLKRAVEQQSDLGDVEFEIIERSVLDTSFAPAVLETAQRCDVVGFSCMCWNLDTQLELARQIKQRNPRTLIVLGGHSAYYEKDDIFARCPWVDVIVNGEGEEAFVDLLRAHRAGASLDQLGGLCTPANRNAPMLPNIEQPPLAFDAPTQPLSEYYLMETMRGCVYKCDYCTWWVGSRKVRHFSEEYIRMNLQHAVDSGYKKVWLVDAAINFANESLETIARATRAIDPRRKLKFWYFVQWSHFNDSQMPSFEALGADTIHIGLESSNPDVLARAHRKWDEKKVRQCVKSLSTIATPVVDLVLGLPGDTVDGFKRTLEFAQSLDVNVMCFRLMLYPGSEYHSKRKELGLELRPGLMPFVARTPTFSADNLDRLTDTITDLAYFNPENQRYFLYEPVDYWEGAAPAVPVFEK